MLPDYSVDQFKWVYLSMSNLWVGIFKEGKQQRKLSMMYAVSINVEGRTETKTFRRWIGDQDAISAGSMISRYQHTEGGKLTFEIQFPLED